VRRRPRGITVFRYTKMVAFAGTPYIDVETFTTWAAVLVAEAVATVGTVGNVAEPPELFQLKCLSHASGAVTHLNRNNPSVPQI
jgi:hypothetical protein